MSLSCRPELSYEKRIFFPPPPLLLPLPLQSYNLLQPIQNSLHPHTSRILPLQHETPQIRPLDTRQQSARPAYIPHAIAQRLGANDENIRNLLEHIETRFETRGQIPAAQQLAVLGDVFGDGESAGLRHAESFVMIEEETSKSDGEFEREGLEDFAGEGSFRARLQAVQESEDGLAGWGLELVELQVRVVAGAVVRLFLTGEQACCPGEGGVDCALQDRIDLALHAVGEGRGALLEVAADGEVCGGEGEEEHFDGCQHEVQDADCGAQVGDVGGVGLGFGVLLGGVGFFVGGVEGCFEVDFAHVGDEEVE